MLNKAFCGIAIDFETSHYDAGSACAIGLAKIQNGDVVETRHALICPPNPQVLFTHIHGLTWAMLHNQPNFAQVWQGLADFVQGAEFFVAHNASFDRRVLQTCCKNAGMPVPRLPFYCTLRGARKHLPLASRKLNMVCAYFGIPLVHHNAESDALAAARIFLKLHDMAIPLRDLRLT